MNHQLKRSIQKAFAAPKPDPQEKARFLKTLPQPQIGMFRFILVQASYLRKATWILSGLILLLALFGARNMRQDTLWIISAFVPVLGLLAVTESTRSMTYGMSEFSSKLFVYRGSGLTSAGFNFYTYVFGATVLFVAALVLNLRREQPVQRAKTLIKNVRWYLVVMAICLFANSYFKVLAAGSLDASVMYPLAQGGSLILSVVMSAFLFREKITKQSILGVILAFLGSMALNL